MYDCGILAFDADWTVYVKAAITCSLLFTLSFIQFKERESSTQADTLGQGPPSGNYAEECPAVVM